MDREQIIKDAQVVVDAEGESMSPTLYDRLFGHFLRGRDYAELRIVSRREHGDAYKVAFNQWAGELPIPHTEIPLAGTPEFFMITWRYDESLPADVVLMETGRAHGVIVNLAVR